MLAENQTLRNRASDSARTTCSSSFESSFRRSRTAFNVFPNLDGWGAGACECTTGVVETVCGGSGGIKALFTMCTEDVTTGGGGMLPDEPILVFDEENKWGDAGFVDVVVDDDGDVVVLVAPAEAVIDRGADCGRIRCSGSATLPTLLE